MQKISSNSIRAIACLLGLSIIGLCGYSQNANQSSDLKNIVLPSPTTAALGQYGNTPVGLYTGTTQVNVPLYEIHEGALKLPISLSYHSGGIKVAEMASWVGLGWSLNAGGSISRTVYGLPDEFSINAFYTLTNNPPSLGDMKKILFNQYDAQPDVFYFNFNGKSGKFFITKNNIIPISPHQNLKIQAIQSNGSSMDPPFIGLDAVLQFRITDEDGIVYEFRDHETTRSTTFSASIGNEPDVIQPGNATNITAWYLTDMYSPTGDTIRFIYDDYMLTYDIASSEQQFVSTFMTNPNQQRYVKNVTKSLTHNKRLRQIQFSNGSLNLAATTPRNDLVGDTMLNSISMWDANGRLIKGYNLLYNSTDGPGTMDDNTYSGYLNGYTLVSNRRLMLEGVSELDSAGIPNGKNYSFDYNMSPALPSTFSKARDFWGYWNGSSENETSFLDYQLVGTDIGIISNYQLINKEPSLNYCKANSLSRIHYPTGGYTQFNYELHDAYVGRGVLPPQVVTASHTMSINFSNYSSLGYVDTVISGVDCKYMPFSVSTGAGATVTITIAGMLYQSPGIVQKFDLYTSDNQSVLRMRDIIDDPSTQTNLNTTTQSVQYICNHFLSDGQYKVIFTPITSYIGSNNYLNQYGANPSCTLNGWSDVITHSDSVNITRSIGGLRIQSTEDYDPVSQAYLKKDYYYKLPGDTISSGTLVSAPSFIYNHSEIDYSTHSTAGPYDYVVINGESNAPLTTTQGSNVGYSRVTVVQSDAITGVPNGMSEYFYTTSQFFPDYNGLTWYGPVTFPSNCAQVNLYSYNSGANNPYPYAPADDRDWQRGLLLKQIDYKYSSESYVPIRSETITYNPPVYMDTVIGILARYDREALPGTTDTVLFQMVPGPVISSLQEEIAIKTYGYTEGYVLPSSKTVTTIDDNGHEITTVENYRYDDAPENMQRTQLKTVNSKGNLITTDYKYPTDYTIPGTAATAQAQGLVNLQQQHVITPAVEQVTRLSDSTGANTRVIGGAYTSFKSTLPLPDTIFRLEVSHPLTDYSAVSVSASATTMDSHYAPFVAYGAYDARGNLLQQNKVNDQQHAYIWDYKGMYPIAEAINASQTEIAYTSFEADGSGGWTIGSSSRDLARAITGGRSFSLNSNISRAGLSSSKVYIVSYWSGNNSSYSISGTMSGFPTKGKTITINGSSWTFYLHKISGQTSITINGNGSIDELRLYPANAQMTTYTFTPLVGMTSSCDVGNRITYYEYDGLQRLKRVRDQDYNIIKSLDYQYQASSGCGNNCYAIAMHTLAGANTLGYPVGVFSVNGKLLGNATGPSQYVTLWNSDTTDSHIGTLSTGADSLHFNMTLNSGQSLPSGVTGCRYYQVDLAWDKFDGLRNTNAAYVDFGDSLGIRLPGNATDIATLPSNTTYGITFSPTEELLSVPYYIHTYRDTTLKTLTFYHNDDALNSHLDNLTSPATGLTKLKHFRGNLPQGLDIFGGSCYQQASMNTIDSIRNWSSLHSITYIHFLSGDEVNPCKHMSYAQDFMQNNKGLQRISTSLSYYRNGYRDTTFKLSRLKSDWNTYFTSLQGIAINDDHWNREDLSALTQLNSFTLVATTQNHQDDTNSPLVPIPGSVIDSIFIQIAAGAGQTVNNGAIGIFAGGSTRTAASDAAVQFLLSKGWVITINGVYITNP